MVSPLRSPQVSRRLFLQVNLRRFQVDNRHRCRQDSPLPYHPGNRHQFLLVSHLRFQVDNPLLFQVDNRRKYPQGNLLPYLQVNRLLFQVGNPRRFPLDNPRKYRVDSPHPSQVDSRLPFQVHSPLLSRHRIQVLNPVANHPHRHPPNLPVNQQVHRLISQLPGQRRNHLHSLHPCLQGSRLASLQANLLPSRPHCQPPSLQGNLQLSPLRNRRVSRHHYPPVSPPLLHLVNLPNHLLANPPLNRVANRRAYRQGSPVRFPLGSQPYCQVVSRQLFLQVSPQVDPQISLQAFQQDNQPTHLLVSLLVSLQAFLRDNQLVCLQVNQLGSLLPTPPVSLLDSRLVNRRQYRPAILLVSPRVSLQAFLRDN